MSGTVMFTASRSPTHGAARTGKLRHQVRTVKVIWRKWEGWGHLALIADWQCGGMSQRPVSGEELPPCRRCALSEGEQT